MERPIFERVIAGLKRNHKSNQKKGVYGYMGWSALKILLIYVITVVPLIILLQRYVDLKPVFEFITTRFSDAFVLIIFTVSETILGMIPPDFFIIWTGKFSSPMILLVLLGILSYTGGILSYFIGRWLSGRKKIKEYSERALEKYIAMVRKWGGAFIIISALFPYSPFSLVVIAVSLLKYPFRLFLIFGLSRIMRFIIQGIFYLHILDLDKLFG
jgi:membrane protein YqaA with SNARE-associated domain